MSDIKNFFDVKLREHLNDNEDLVEDIDATYLFNVDSESWYVDLTKFPPVIEEKTDEADCTIGIAATDLIAIADKKITGMEAFMQGKLKVDNMPLSLRLQSILDFDE